MRKIIAITAAMLTLGSAIVTAAPVEAREWRKQGMSGHHYQGGKHFSRSDRHHYRGNRYYGHRNYGPRYGYRYDRGYNNGAVAAGIIGGIAAGALIGSAARAQADDGSTYCASRYRSYDPRSGTYLSYDGNRYPCP